MNRFLLFGGKNYDGFRNPKGGWEDFQAAYSNIPDALVAVLERKLDWYQVVDKATCMIVNQGNKRIFDAGRES